MLVSKILKDAKILNNFSTMRDFNEIKKNSKLVEEGDIFFDLSSLYESGVQNSKEALKRGAVAVVSENRLPVENLYLVDDVHSVFSSACANFYDNPASKMKLIGITGTNGKTTCTHLVCEELKSLGKKVGTIGTMGVKFGGREIDLSMTTPDADDLQKCFDMMQKDGVEYVVMEVSAHAISQKRVAGLHFDVGVLTNITQDHLDYFGTMENYRDCKLSFLNSNHIKSAVVCVDDESVRQYIDKIDVPFITYGLNNPADVFAVDVKSRMEGAEFYANVLDSVLKIDTNLVGKYNILNVLASLSVVSSLGIEVEKVVESLKYINPVEGRFNVLKYQGKYIIIDFAHTPDGLENVLSTAKGVCNGELHCVFGCGGNRDSNKRAKMGAIAEKFCDHIFLTNDNPRKESPEKIVKDIEKGMKKAHFVELDRQTAIANAIHFAKENDVIVIAGKGGEKYQIIGDEKRDYNDFNAVYNVIKGDLKVEEKEKYGN